MKVTYGAKNFESNLLVNFKIYKYDGELITEETGNEINDLGVYFIDIDLDVKHAPYISIAEEINSVLHGKAFETISAKDIIWKT